MRGAVGRRQRDSRGWGAWAFLFLFATCMEMERGHSHCIRCLATRRLAPIDGDHGGGSEVAWVMVAAGGAGQTWRWRPSAQFNGSPGIHPIQ